MNPAPIRVGFVIDRLLPGGGTENQLLILARGLNRARVTPYICCLRDHPLRIHADAGETEVRIIDSHRLLSPRLLRDFTRLRRWVLDRDLDLIVTLHRDANIIGTLGARWAGVPVISTRRNLGASWQTSRELALLRFLNRFSRAILTNAETIRRYTIEVEGVDPDRVSVIPNAVDTERFRPRTTDRAKLGLPTEGPLVGCVANLRPIKGLDVLIRAFSDPRIRATGATLVLMGEGSEESRLEALAAGLGVPLRLLGSRQDVPALLGAFDLGVLPSRSEAMPNAVLEYLSSGLACVTTDVGGSAELLRGGELGLLVPPEDPAALADAMARLLADTELRRELGHRGRAEALDRYRVETILDVWTEFLTATAAG